MPETDAETTGFPPFIWKGEHLDTIGKLLDGVVACATREGEPDDHPREVDMGLEPVNDIGSEGWLRERFPDKDWHRHHRTDGRTDWCDGTPSDCRSKVRLP